MRRELEAAIHVSLVNRGVLIAPFHNMMLVSPVTEKTQVDRLVSRLRRYCGAARCVRQARRIVL